MYMHYIVIHVRHLKCLFCGLQINRGIAVIIVQRENGLEKIKEILNGESSNLKIPAVSLIRNLSRYDRLRPAIGNF